MHRRPAHLKVMTQSNVITSVNTKMPHRKCIKIISLFRLALFVSRISACMIFLLFETQFFDVEINEAATITRTDPKGGNHQLKW
jgi:hypothetical protein